MGLQKEGQAVGKALAEPNRHPLGVGVMLDKQIRCFYCHQWFPWQAVGTHQRNHCPHCLYSKHVDYRRVGDRSSKCQELMSPLGLTFKKVRPDKYRVSEKGELAIVHLCLVCEKITVNRLSGDDAVQAVWTLFTREQKINSKVKEKLDKTGVLLLDSTDEPEVKTQLWGQTSGADKSGSTLLESDSQPRR